MKVLWYGIRRRNPCGGGCGPSARGPKTEPVSPKTLPPADWIRHHSGLDADVPQAQGASVEEASVGFGFLGAPGRLRPVRGRVGRRVGTGSLFGPRTIRRLASR